MQIRRLQFLFPDAFIISTYRDRMSVISTDIRYSCCSQYPIHVYQFSLSQTISDILTQPMFIDDNNPTDQLLIFDILWFAKCRYRLLMKTPACRTSRESMGYKTPPNNFDLDPVILTYDLWPWPLTLVTLTLTLVTLALDHPFWN